MPNCGQNQYIGTQPATSPSAAYDPRKRFLTLTVSTGLAGADALRVGVANYNVFARNWVVTDPNVAAWRAAWLARYQEIVLPTDEVWWEDVWTLEGVRRRWWLADINGNNPRDVAWETLIASNPTTWDLLAAAAADQASALWPLVPAGKAIRFMWVWDAVPGQPHSGTSGRMVPFDMDFYGNKTTLFTLKSRAGIADTLPGNGVAELNYCGIVGMGLFGWFGVDAHFSEGVTAVGLGESGFLAVMQVRLNPGSYCCQNWEQSPDYDLAVDSLDSGDYRLDHFNGYNGGANGMTGWVFPVIWEAVDRGHTAAGTGEGGIIREPSDYWGIKEVFLHGGGPC